MTPPWRRAGAGLEIFIRLKPGAARDAIGGSEQGPDGRPYLSARVRAVPEGGAANQALVRLLARALDVPPSSVSVTAGFKSRLKMLTLAGEPASLEERLSRLIQS